MSANKATLGTYTTSQDHLSVRCTDRDPNTRTPFIGDSYVTVLQRQRHRELCALLPAICELEVEKANSIKNLYYHCQQRGDKANKLQVCMHIHICLYFPYSSFLYSVFYDSSPLYSITYSTYPNPLSPSDPPTWTRPLPSITALSV